MVTDVTVEFWWALLAESLVHIYLQALTCWDWHPVVLHWGRNILIHALREWLDEGAAPLGCSPRMPVVCTLFQCCSPRRCLANSIPDPDRVHISFEAFQSASWFIILYLCVGACDFFSCAFHYISCMHYYITTGWSEIIWYSRCEWSCWTCDDLLWSEIWWYSRCEWSCDTFYDPMWSGIYMMLLMWVVMLYQRWSDMRMILQMLG